MNVEALVVMSILDVSIGCPPIGIFTMFYLFWLRGFKMEY